MSQSVLSQSILLGEMISYKHCKNADVFLYENTLALIREGIAIDYNNVVSILKVSKCAVT